MHAHAVRAHMRTRNQHLLSGKYSTDATTDKGAYFGPNGWLSPINYEVFSIRERRNGERTHGQVRGREGGRGERGNQIRTSTTFILDMSLCLAPLADVVYHPPFIACK